MYEKGTHATGGSREGAWVINMCNEWLVALPWGKLCRPHNRVGSLLTLPCTMCPSAHSGSASMWSMRPGLMMPRVLMCSSLITEWSAAGEHPAMKAWGHALASRAVAVSLHAFSCLAPTLGGVDCNVCPLPSCFLVFQGS